MKDRGNSFGKKGQVTIFIIVAVLVVSISVLAYFFLPGVLVDLGISSQNPNEYVQGCLEDSIRENVKTISEQGGSLNPEHYVTDKDQKIEYLCYTDENYLPCVMQQPLLKQHVEGEIENAIKSQADSCIDSLKETFEKKGYTASIGAGEMKIELLPQRIVSTFDGQVTLTKESSERFDKISVVVNNNIYELITIANSILNWEARYGEAETTIYMNYYNDLKVEKNLQSDGTTIYRLTNRETGDKFQFASRSVALPPGIGVENA